MKFALVAFAVLAVFASTLNAYKLPASGSGELAKELQDFVDLVPVPQIVAIVREYVAKDKEVQAVGKIAASGDSAALIKEVEAIPEFKQLVDYVQKAGLDMKLLINKLNKAFNLKPLASYSTYLEITGGIKGLRDDLIKALPVSKLRDLYNEKINSSEVLKNLLAEVTSAKYQPLFQGVVKSSNLKKLHSSAMNAGIAEEDFPIGYSITLSAHVVRQNRP